MTALGSIGVSAFDRWSSLRELTLEKECTTVDDVEAEYGAAQSDSIRFAAKQNSQEEKVVPYSTYVKRALQFGQQIKKEAGKKDDVKENSCPIDKARSESAVGMNAPLNWLMADQMGGQTSTPERSDFVSQPEISFQDPGALLIETASSHVEESSGGTLLSQEWLLSPCA